MKNTKNKCTLSRLTQYLFLILYSFTVLFGVVITMVLLLFSQYDYVVNLLISLFSFVGISATVSIAFYFKKAEKENDKKLTNAKYDNRLTDAMEIKVKLDSEQINAESIVAYKELISDSQTTIQNFPFGTQVKEETTFATVVPKITEELSEHIKNRGE